MRFFKILPVFLFLTIVFSASYALEAKQENNLSWALSTLPETKLTFTHSITLPFLTGDGPLFSGNHVKFNLSGEISPVSINAVSEMIWAPIAVIELSAGASVGSGWNTPLGNGIGTNIRIGTTSNNISTTPFIGAVYKFKFGGAFQFDTGAVIPGDWSHVVIRAYQEINYRGLSSASATTPWAYEADAGENLNGWKYYANYFLGYQMPIILQTIGFYAESDTALYNSTGGSVWGENVPFWTIGPLANFQFTRNFSTAVLVQFKTVRNFTGNSTGFYQDRVLDTANPASMPFYRVALILNYAL